MEKRAKTLKEAKQIALDVLTKLQNKVQMLEQMFVNPLLGTCATCIYNDYGGPNADADDCTRDDYDGGDPACVDGWWDGYKCIKWEPLEWINYKKQK